MMSKLMTRQTTLLGVIEGGDNLKRQLVTRDVKPGDNDVW